MLTPSAHVLGAQAVASLSTSYPNLGPAVAATKAGTSRTIIANVGDSLTYGWGATTTTGTGVGASPGPVGRRVNAWPQQTKALWIAAGVNCRSDAFWGCSTAAAVGVGQTAAVTEFLAYNPLFTMGSGWWVSNIQGPGANYMQCAAGAAGTMTFTPEIAANRLDIYHTRFSGSGTLAVSDSGGALGSVVGSDPTYGLFKTTISRTTPSTLPFTFTPSVSGDIYIIGIVPYNTAAPAVEIWNMGASGTTVANWNAAGDAAGPTPGLQFITPVPHLYTIELGANDAAAAVSAATYQTSLNTLITTLKALGKDVQLVKCNPASPTSDGYNIPAGYLTAMDSLTTSQSLRPAVDFNSLTYTTPDDYYDHIHLTASGYTKQKTVAFAAFTA